MRNFAVAMLFLSGITTAFANPTLMVNQEKVIRTLKNQTLLPVIFPSKIPDVAAQKLYMSANSYGVHPDYQKFWQLNADTTATCQGVKVCNVGFISAEANGQLDLSYTTLPDNKNHLKEQVKLQNNKLGYYTPFHIQASGVNPTLEWKEKNILYTLSWQIQADVAQQKQILIEMANSAISSTGK